jgi:hypothetical protein
MFRSVGGSWGADAPAAAIGGVVFFVLIMRFDLFVVVVGLPAWCR